MTNWTAETRGIELRAIPGDINGNTFEGLACKFGEVDSYGTTFVAGCFTRGGLDAGTYSLLWMHDPNRPVGTFTAEERLDGLYIVGQWDQNTAGQEARASALSGSAADLSVGFSWQADQADPNTIKVASLREVSQVTSRFGSVPGSKLTAVRNAIDDLFALEEEELALAVVEAEIEIAVPTEERWTVIVENEPEQPAETTPTVEEIPAVEPIEEPAVEVEPVVEAPKKAKREDANDALQAYVRLFI